MSSFSDPIYEITTITNNLCSFEAIGLSEYDNRVNDSTYIYSGLTLILGYVDFESHFDTDEHMYSNVILSNDVYTYTGITGETHYFEIVDFYLGTDHFIDPLLNLSTEGEVIDGFTTDIIHCVEQLDGLSGTCCPTQQVLTSLPIVFITNEGGGSDNCDDFIARRTPRGWTLDFVFNKNGDVNTQESVFWFTGVRDEYEIENYADNGLSFRITTEGKIMWSAYRFSGYCDSSAEYQELFYIETGSTANSLCSGGTSNDFSIIITFERYNVYEDECDLANQGGWNDLIWTGTSETLIKKWTDERNKRLGVLKIYHNGKPIYKLKDFEETVLSDRGYEPFTHVIGGGVTGSGGIHEGSFCYSIKRAAYYEEPMTFLDVQTHYNTNISPNFTINDCSAPCTDNIVIVTPSRTPTMTRTPSVTPTVTRTPSLTPTMTRTPSITPTPAGINSVLGLLYNGHVISDARGLIDPDWHIPTVGDFNILISNLGGSTVAGGELKEVDGSYWNTPNIGATNSSNFTARGAGRRSPTGIFERILDSAYFWTSSQLSGSIYYIYNINYSSSFFYLGNSEIERGLSIRPVKNTTTLSHGQMGTYTGKDGRIYRTIAIGTGTTQEWLVGNLAETQYQNGDIITEVRDASAWSNLTSPACCAYDNNWTYVSGVAPTPTPSMTLTPTITPSNPYWSTRYPDNLYGSVLTGVTGTTIYLTWTNNGTQDYDNIIIERSADSGSTYSEINSILSGEIEYIDETILDIQTYYYRVRYKLNTAYSIYSNIYIITEDELLSSYWINLIFTQDEQFYLMTEDSEYFIQQEDESTE